MGPIQENTTAIDDSMATEKSSTTGKKAADEHLDQKPSLLVDEAEPEKNLPAINKVDYSGAYEKTDPKEIALVKKLDRWIMVCHFATPRVITLEINNMEN